MESTYVVPLIPQNLYKHETIVQIAELLDHLTNVSEGIFAQINRRLENNRLQLSNISKRVDKVNRKISSLRGAKKATQVFSSSKYPASDIYREYISLFHDCLPIKLKRHSVKLKDSPAVQGPLEKLQFYHVNIQKNSENRLDGLGDITLQSIEFVNDLLLYNSGKNLFKDFVISHALNAPQQIKIFEEHESELGAAPQSISERSIHLKAHKQSYFYTPQTGQVPALDVPLDLPDLPGIANDLQYDNDFSASIAPSADLTLSILELDLQTSQDLPTIPLEDDEIKEISNIPIAELPPVPQVENIKLPSPPPDITIKTENKKRVGVQEEQKKSVEKVSSTAPVVDMRSSLMEAIRNAGGTGKAKLKSLDEKKEQQTVVKVTQGGDLMADLHNKLFMRRKGISGAKRNEENSIDADSTLSRISSMIPPPEPKNEPKSASSDEDWE